MNTLVKLSSHSSFLVTLVCLLLFFTSSAQRMERYRYEELKMGSPFQIILYSRDSMRANIIANKAFELVDSLNMIFSDYEMESELTTLSQTAGTNTYVQVSPLLYDMLNLSRKAWKASEGKFDITIGPLSRVWREARKTSQFPKDSLINIAKSKTGMQYLLIDSIRNSVILTLPGMKLDLGGIAKGFIAQYILDYLQGQGYDRALVDAGGDIACGEAPPEKDGWSIGVSIPGSLTNILPSNLVLKNQSIATSGNLYQFIEYKGKKYSHEINPQTGYGMQSQRSVTVIAREAQLSDWLATACSILSITKSKKLAESYGAELLILSLKNNKIHYHHTKGFPKLWHKANKNP